VYTKALKKLAGEDMEIVQVAIKTWLDNAFKEPGRQNAERFVAGIIMLYHFGALLVAAQPTLIDLISI
jgi:hypothetical protein